MLGGPVEPVGRWRIFHPGIQRADMVGDHVEEDLHVLLVRGVDQLLVVRKGAEMRIDGVKIDGAVAVIARGRSIFDDGREPKRGDAEILQIREMRLDATQITAMIGTWIAAIVRVREFLWLVVGRITVGETVGHDEVQDVVERKTLIAAENLFAGGQGKFEGSLASRGGDAADGGTFLKMRAEFQPNEEVITVGGGLRAAEVDIREVASDMRGLKIFAGEEHEKVGSKVKPPVGRFDLGDHGGVGVGGGLGVSGERQEVKEDKEVKEAEERMDARFGGERMGKHAHARERLAEPEREER